MTFPCCVVPGKERTRCSGEETSMCLSNSSTLPSMGGSRAVAAPRDGPCPCCSAAHGGHQRQWRGFRRVAVLRAQGWLTANGNCACWSLGAQTCKCASSLSTAAADMVRTARGRAGVGAGPRNRAPGRRARRGEASTSITTSAATRQQARSMRGGGACRPGRGVPGDGGAHASAGSASQEGGRQCCCLPQKEYHKKPRISAKVCKVLNKRVVGCTTKYWNSRPFSRQMPTSALAAGRQNRPKSPTTHRRRLR